MLQRPANDRRRRRRRPLDDPDRRDGRDHRFDHGLFPDQAVPVGVLMTDISSTERRVEPRQTPERRRVTREPFVEFEDVSKAYGPQQVLRGANLQVFRGEVMVILGIAVVASVLGALLPAIRAARMNPVEALRWE